jgi:hypothetical protein
LAVGDFRAAMMSWTPAMSLLREDAKGMVTLVGNQVSVSQILSRRVDQIQTR